MVGVWDGQNFSFFLISEAENGKRGRVSAIGSLLLQSRCTPVNV